MDTIENTLFIGKVLMHFSVIGSTNAYAIDLAAKSNPLEGTIVIADYQSQGRGQLGSHWASTTGLNLTFSLILKPRFLSVNDQFMLSKAVALGIVDGISGLLKNSIYVKWPNDIFVDGEKIAGVLIQNSINSRSIQYSTVGIGLNVNETDFSENLTNATSLKKLTGLSFDRSEILEKICKGIESRYLQLKSGQVDQINELYLQHLYLFMEDAVYQNQQGDFFEGKITGIDQSGKLIVDTQQGIQHFGLKEIIYPKLG